jgi:protein-S-isoprenylcysteine O-methyltransferase Ste14
VGNRTVLSGIGQDDKHFIEKRALRMQRIAYFAYGVACYLMFLAVYFYMAGFVLNVIVPKTIDSSVIGSAVESSSPWALAAAVDVGLLLLFGLQHSVMARPQFKAIWTRIVPLTIERSTYVLAANLAMILVLWQWRSIPIVIWDVPSGWGRYLLLSLSAIGFLSVPLVTLLLNHFDLFGLRQVWLHLRGKEYAGLPFNTPLLYRYVRHPLYIAFFAAFWFTPTMTVGHLLFAGTLTAYMAAASIIEERDLVDHFGRLYEDYRRQVPAFVPRIGRRRGASKRPAKLSV